MTEEIKNIEKSEKYKGYKRFLTVVLVIAAMLSSFGFGIYITVKSDAVKQLAIKEVVYAGEVLGKYQKNEDGAYTQDIDFNLFWKTWDALKKQYVDQEKITDKKLFYGALRGMVAAIEDPYTVFMDPKVSEDFSDDLAGTFEGIGAEIGIKGDVLTIIAPLPGMPAELAGIKAGDKILAIDTVITQGMAVDEAVTKIRGPKDTKVTLTIVRDGLSEAKEIEITRGAIVVSSVRTEKKDDGIFIIKIISFNNDTELAFNNAVRSALDSGVKGIILDLRNNPGGYLDTAIEVASEWVDEGPIVYEQYGDDSKIDHLARGRARLKDFLTVVLVNEGSASASEIVAGALQDKGLAKLVGKKTFGKGSVQSLTNLEDGSSIKITIAKWLTPNGRSINDEGVAVDHEVELTLEDYNAGKDPQMEKALWLLSSKEAWSAAPSVLESASSTEDEELAD
ncbi:MAG: Carboxyl-terminal protease [Candidatus Falkowbacteria bacterium GW2011_GWC2_38_22]|uniref:Carboxyl-terminal protease n=1 Tax=Candidatus Falkowbacteria bacterium GW2011_GWE1_38_31 TaxID=1618638 RepID=A0A0G0JWA9_9BACT|nr:MAG: Carboxyl-terminal protease [Candidatus Falkowbacteria bacterium GW2011_GWF2_38_1205]KKQ62087.1 MAG: Carboxyl-terminal protease [Candidatus Falkowbacteria bacterium GW2011_GWC2_38_22]KKQ64237.1 MAG: Carboxyl-terminal protease [Candidatus Falkowbacteria bacterium GW2011_GWF1_38_22]KKQ66214.1 MAG: Carboxyl-terminal protease [Candidatus Falkowbacteria bacterium GW2011_GWE2_38_254]KKQ70942.1 MAG: Carboxyl-terminal protease [Candidatus Falkowbacteria bacterium GW2011_GWE1_38_31]KKQ73451.1 MA